MATKNFLSGAAFGAATILILQQTISIVARKRQRQRQKAASQDKNSQTIKQRRKQQHYRAPKRCGGAIQLKPDQYETYTQLHDNVWPSVLERMSMSNIRNFTIYYHRETDTLYSHFEWIGHWKLVDEEEEEEDCSSGADIDDVVGENDASIIIPKEMKEKEEALFQSDMDAIANDPMVRKWWSLCEPCQIPFPGQWSEEEPPPSEGGTGGDWWKPLVCVCHCGHWPLDYSEERRDPEFVKLSGGGVTEKEA